MRNSFSAKRVDTFIQRPRGAVPRSANELDALSHLLHTRGLVARRRSAAGRARQPRRPKLPASCGWRHCLAAQKKARDKGRGQVLHV